MIFIRSDGSIDRIAENAIPESLEPVVSGGEVAAVLELAGGTAARLDLDEDATVTWKNWADEDHVERDQRVLHQEARDHGLGTGKEHAAVLRARKGAG